MVLIHTPITVAVEVEAGYFLIHAVHADAKTCSTPYTGFGAAGTRRRTARLFNFIFIGVKFSLFRNVCTMEKSKQKISSRSLDLISQPRVYRTNKAYQSGTCRLYTGYAFK